jgi:signal transduction histidine kinase
MNLKRLSSMSYRSRLLWGLLIVNIPMFVILSANEIVAVRNFAFQREIEAITTEGRFLAADVTDALLDHDRARLIEILSFATSQRQIKEASVLDSENTVLASSDPTLVGRIHPSVEHLTVSKLRGRTFLTSFPVHGKMLGGKGPRALQVRYSLERAYGDIGSTLLWEVAIDFVEIFIILLVAWFISGLLQKPLVELRAVSDKMAMGDFSKRVKAGSHDVVGELAAAFNNMASRLQVLTSSMQQEIDRATEALTNRNRDLHEKQLQLESSNKKLRELDVLKSDFVSMVSHELRTPLTSIIGFAKTIRTLPLSGEQQKKYLDIIESEGKRLSSLVEEYLDISKIESGSISLQRTPVNLGNIIRSAVESFPVSGQREIIVDLPPSMPDVMADKGKILRVLYNLIDNAVKYAGEVREIIVTAHLKEDGVAASVRDFGPGIDPDDAGRIFEKFYRGKTQASLRNRGSGLGLAIAKGIIEAHNGKIWCESTPGKGTKFSFFLPFVHAAGLQPAARGASLTL